MSPQGDDFAGLLDFEPEQDEAEQDVDQDEDEPSPPQAASTSQKPRKKAKEQDPDAPPKKKRKQLVACDSCRLRRVKCNKADVGGGDCSECLKKSIRCTDSYIRTKPKVVRTGKLIQQAKQLYGNGHSTDSVKVESPGNSSTDHQGQGSHSPPSSLVRATDARFFNQELARSIADHLVQVFRKYVHGQCAVVDWDHFQPRWDAAGHIAENMSPTMECLSLVMQAWAARFSDHSAIVGHAAPSLLDVENCAPGSDFTSFGANRDAFARAMEDRAMKALDYHGALRRPSGQCCAALSLMEFLVTWGDVYRNHGRHYMTAAVEHLRSRNDGLSDDPSEVISPEDKMSGGTLFWVVYARDALSSAFGGRATALTTEDLSVLCEVLASPITIDVLSYVNSDDPRMLSGLAVVANFRHITTIIRSFCIRVSGPLPRRHRLDIHAIQEMWAAIDQSARYSDIWRQSFARSGHHNPMENQWFQDLHVMRSQLTHAIHINVVDRQQLEKSRLATIRDPTFPAYVDSIERLKSISDERMLSASRDIAELVRAAGNKLNSKGAMAAENLPLYTAHMLAMPVWEQGGPEGWTIAVKHEEVTWMINGMKVLGWSWPGFRRHVDLALECLDDLASQVARARLSTQGPSIQPSPHGMPNFDMHQSQYPPGQNGWYPSSFPPPPNVPQGAPPSLPSMYSAFDYSPSNLHRVPPSQHIPSNLPTHPSANQQPYGHLNGYSLSRPPSSERNQGPPMYDQNGGSARGPEDPPYPFAWNDQHSEDAIVR